MATKTKLEVSLEEANLQISQQIEQGNGLRGWPKKTKEELKALKSQYEQWNRFNATMLAHLFSTDELTKEYDSHYSGIKLSRDRTLDQEAQSIHDHIEHYIKQLISIKNRLKFYLSSTSVESKKDFDVGQEESTANNRVFIVHGHDDGAKFEVARTLEKLKMTAVILHEQPNGGKTIIEKFERDASNVSFAVILLTPDDIGHPKGKPDEAKSRARQNVILELGFFTGVLGRSNVCVLHKGDVEIPSDYQGVTYILMDSGSNWKYEVCKELRQAGLPADSNDL
jgi:predicted nucleotide-binding protein